MNSRAKPAVKANGLPKPFIKWAGGKGQLVPELLARAPERFETYHEPFLGGAAVFFALHRAKLLTGKKVVLSDVNQELVDTYRAIRNQVSKVIEYLQQHKYEKDHYYLVRAQDPAKLKLAQRAARMIYMNKTGFNGLYRVNSKGKFNVPFGRFVNPKFCDPDNLRSTSRALKQVELRCEPFQGVLERAKPGDFVYFDPPYVPVSQTAKFVSYASKGFDLEDQERLATVFEDLTQKGVMTMLSNSDTPWVKKRYRPFPQIQVQVRRSVNSRKDRRGPVGELVVLGFESKGAG